MADAKIAPALSDLRIPIDSVSPFPGNPRDGDVGAISESLRRFGQQKPIVVQESSRYIVAGNHLWKAAKALNWKEIAANVSDLDDREAEAYLIADNRTSELGSYDEELLADLLRKLASEGNLRATGYDGDDVDAFLAKLQAEGMRIPPEIAFSEELMESHNYVVLYFDNEIDWNAAQTRFGLQTVLAPDATETLRPEGSREDPPGSGRPPDDGVIDLVERLREVRREVLDLGAGNSRVLAILDRHIAALDAQPVGLDVERLAKALRKTFPEQRGAGRATVGSRARRVPFRRVRRPRQRAAAMNPPPGPALPIVAVASFGRAGRVSTVDVFPNGIVVVPQRQTDSYAALQDLPEGWEIVGIPDEADGNIARKRNAILDLFPGRDLVMLDDDYDYIGRWEGGIDHHLDGDGIRHLLEQGFSLARDLDTPLWGINVQVDRRFYREYTPFSITNPVLGPFQAWSADRPPDLRYDPDLFLKEDFDMSLRVLQRFHRILRMNAYHYKVDHYNALGGVVGTRNMGEEVRQLHALQRRWGSSVRQDPTSSERCARTESAPQRCLIASRSPARGLGATGR